MKMLFEAMKKCKGNRENYRLKPSIRFEADRQYYWFAFIPTITFIPWVSRYPNSDGIVDIWWLHFHILIGKWERGGD